MQKIKYKKLCLMARFTKEKMGEEEEKGERKEKKREEDERKQSCCERRKKMKDGREAVVPLGERRLQKIL